MRYNRQKLLLQAVGFLAKNGIYSKTYLVKALFLLRQKFGFKAIGYDFFPYKYGPFSNEIYLDFNYLNKEGLFNEEEMRLTKEGEDFVAGLEEAKPIFSKLNKIVSDFPSSFKLKKFVYDKYPEFTVGADSSKKTRIAEKGICSIGYEGRTIDGFLDTLIHNNISLLVDVRKNAFSMKRGFSKGQLKNYLEKSGIGYLHVPEVGIESDKRRELNSREDYKKLFKEYAKTLPLKRHKVEKIAELGKNQKIALMCFEADKNFCHRGVLSDFLDCKVTHL